VPRVGSVHDRDRHSTRTRNAVDRGGKSRAAYGPLVNEAVRFGIFLNNRGAVFLGDAYTITDLVALAERAEARGFDFVSVGDSLVAKPRYAPIPILAALAARTTEIELTTGILQPHLRPVLQLAQEWATLHALSGGRTSLGVGLGTGPPDLVDIELALAGHTRRGRARAFERSIEQLRALLRGDTVEVDGHAVAIGLPPAPKLPPRLLIACGAFVASRAGFGPNDVHDPSHAGKIVGPLNRVARLADGWISGIAHPDEWQRLWARVREEGEAAGRDLDQPSFERRFNTYLHVGDHVATARHEGVAFLEAYHRLPMDDATVDRWLVHGPPERCAERLRALVDAGVTSFQFVLASADQAGQLERLAGDVRPLVLGAGARR
jgi:alkanesulfonate monooxygenase SsuD/methylene tetrahydromethanopterin reductase-like flavin-dependent oxidoreductase (luciferase family)